MSRILINDGSVLVSQLIPAETAAARMRGLLGRSSLPAGAGMLFLPGGSIHMWFMRFPIDAVFLDRDLRVLKIARHLRPWQIALAPRSTHAVLETAAGQMHRLTVGDRLVVER